MAEEALVKYIKENYPKFPIDAIKNKILSKGYSSEQFDSALNASEVLNRGEKFPESSFPAGESGKTGTGLIKTAAIIGFIFFVLGLGVYIMNIVSPFMAENITPVVLTGTPSPSMISFSLWTFFSILILFGIACLLYHFGFYKLGKLKELPVIRVTSIINMIFIALLLGVIAYGFYNMMSIIQNTPSFSPYSDQEFKVPIMVYIILGIILIAVVNRMVFFSSLLKSNLKYSTLAGTFGLISFSLAILLVAFIIWIFYYIIAHPEVFMTLLFTPGNYAIYFTILSVTNHAITITFLVGLLFESLLLWDASKSA